VQKKIPSRPPRQPSATSALKLLLPEWEFTRVSSTRPSREQFPGRLFDAFFEAWPSEFVPLQAGRVWREKLDDDQAGLLEETCPEQSGIERHGHAGNIEPLVEADDAGLVVGRRTNRLSRAFRKTTIPRPWANASREALVIGAQGNATAPTIYGDHAHLARVPAVEGNAHQFALGARRRVSQKKEQGNRVPHRHVLGSERARAWREFRRELRSRARQTLSDPQYARAQLRPQ